jgi:phage anti-repressor protein
MIKINDNGKVNARNVYEFIGVKTRFNDWIRNSLHYVDAQENKDFYSKLSESTGGRPSIDYELTIDCAKEICLVQPNEKSKALRKWLISLSNKVDSGLLISPAQVLDIVRMIKVFSIYEYRKLALEKNQDHYIKNALMLKSSLEKNKSLLYSGFHKWRNEVLHLGREELDRRVLDYCIIEQRRLPKFKNKDEMLTFLGQHEMIKNAIWDLLSSQNKSEEMINNICNLAAELAKEMKPFLERLNQSNLFFERIEETNLKAIL